MEESPGPGVEHVFIFGKAILFCKLVTLAFVGLREVSSLREEQQLQGVLGTGEVGEGLSHLFLVMDPLAR